MLITYILINISQIYNKKDTLSTNISKKNFFKN